MARKPGRKSLPIATAREWLRLREEEGLSYKDIGKKGNDYYDSRTVEKAIERAYRDREEREASVIVLRNAKEDHYKDLIKYANKLDEAIQKEPLSIKFDRYYDALKEHLPKSPMWKALDELIKLDKEIIDLKVELLNEVPDINLENSSVEYAIYKNNLKEAILEDTINPQNRKPIVSYQTAPGCVGISKGDIRLGIVPEKDTDKIVKEFGFIIKSNTSSKNAKDLQKKFEERSVKIEKIREEIAVIAIKRILPGRCKYCPF